MFLFWLCCLILVVLLIVCASVLFDCFGVAILLCLVSFAGVCCCICLAAESLRFRCLGCCGSFVCLLVCW